MNSLLSKKRTGPSVQEKNYKPVPHIPSPVVSDIISYLPLKTAVQSKILCKELEDLISNPNFAKSHFSKSPRGLFLYSENSGNVLYFVDLSDSSLRFKLGGDTYIPHKAIVGKFSSTKIKFGKCLISSCNGFLCFCDTNPNSCYYICNPITRDYIITPPLSDVRSSDISKVHWRSEFGFSPKTGQFKVLRLKLSFKQTAKIFTLGQKSWRSIDIPRDFNPYGKMAFLNGIFHWLSYREKILSFDVGSETFHEFSFPLDLCSDDDKSTSYNYSLGILDECISLCRANYEEGQIEIWILKEYGVTESWVKEFVINDAGKFASRLRVLWVMEDGKKGQNVLLVCSQSAVVTYDPVGGMCSFLKFDGIWESLTLLPHIPSLIPLKDAIIFDENSKMEDENEDMSPKPIVPRRTGLSDTWRSRWSNPSSRMESSSDLYTAEEEELLAKIDELIYGKSFRKKFMDSAKELSCMGDPGGPSAADDLSNDSSGDDDDDITSENDNQTDDD